MKVAWRGARDVMGRAKRLWAVVKGPAAAAWASLHRIGWRFASPFEVISDLGIEHDLLHISPKRFQRRLHEGVNRWAWRKVLKQMGLNEGEAMAIGGRAVGEWIRNMLHGKGELSVQERGALRSVVDGSAWTEERCWEEGYLEFPLCKWCLAGPGNTKHRAFDCGGLVKCKDNELERGWREEGRRADKNDPFWSRMIPVGPERVGWLRKEDVEIEWFKEEGIMTGEVFGDGSVQGPVGIKRGGSAFGVLESGVEEVIEGLGENAMVGAMVRLGGEDHSSADAELNALVHLLKVATPPVHYITDSMLIVNGVAAGEGTTTRPDKMHADWWREVWGSVVGWGRGELKASHVKAHRDRRVVHDNEEAVRWWHGNRVADIWAGRAAERNSVSDEAKKEVRMGRRRYKEVSAWVGKVTRYCAEVMPWEKEGRRWGGLGVRGGGVWRVPRHELVGGGGKMWCKHCSREGSTKAAIKRLKSLPCWGSVTHRVGAYARKKGRSEVPVGHLLQVSWPIRSKGDGVIWCVVCGAYAEKAPRNLVKPCTGMPSRAGLANLAAFKKNKHPKGRRRLTEATPYLLEGEHKEEEGRKRSREDAGLEWGGVGWEPEGLEQEAEWLEERQAVGEEAFEEPPVLDQGYAAEVEETGGAERTEAGVGAVSGERVSMGPVFSLGGVVIGGADVGRMLAEPCQRGSNKRSRFRF